MEFQLRTKGSSINDDPAVLAALVQAQPNVTTRILAKLSKCSGCRCARFRIMNAQRIEFGVSNWPAMPLAGYWRD